MSRLNRFRLSAEHALVFIRQLASHLGAFLRTLFLPKAALAARLLAAESQLAACTLRINQRKEPRPRFTQAFRFLRVVLNARHLNRLLREFINDDYHVARPHQGLKGDTPAGYVRPKHIRGSCKRTSFPVCDGLHHRCERVAA